MFVCERGQLADLLFGPPIIIPLQGTFAGHGDPIHLADATEELEHGAVRQPGGEPAIIFLEQDPANIAAQSAAAVELAGLLGLGANILALVQPGLAATGFPSRSGAAVHRCAAIGRGSLGNRHCPRWWAEWGAVAVGTE